jgi:hypothetical protein
MYGLDHLPKGGTLSQAPACVRFTCLSSHFYVQALYQNCSHLCMTNIVVSTLNKENLGLFKSFVDWAYANNYTKVFATMSSSSPLKLALLKQLGFTGVGRPYTSRRTGNKIYWLQGDLKKLQDNIEQIRKEKKW